MPVDLIISPRTRDVGEFTVQRLLPYAKRRMVGPWIFFDHMGPVEFEPGNGINVAQHPHINLATVTYLFDGEILHRDSLGSVQAIQPGDINLMVAGSGITHSERQTEETKSQNQRVHGLQLWHALPEQEEETAPAFYHYPSASLPVVEVAGVAVKLMMGEAYGHSSPVKTFVETLYLEARLEKGQTLETPAARELAVYVVSGSLEIEGEPVPALSMAVLVNGSRADLKASQDCHVVLIGGAPLGTRYMFWNFVSSRQDRLEQAKRDWQAGRFEKVPNDQEDTLPLPQA